MTTIVHHRDETGAAASYAEFNVLRTENERLRRVILRRNMDENDCARKCVGGWNAQNCICAEEARNAYAAQL